MLLDLLILEFLVALATMYANVTVPVVPDPNYLNQIYPTSTIPDQYLQAPVNQQQLNGATQPTDIMSVVSLAVTAGLGYLFQKQKTTTDRRTYMAADTTLKLAQNDQNSDAKVVKLTYAVSCLCDIVGKFHKDDLETYQTIDGVSLWTYIENLNIENNNDFQARYINKPPVQPTGSQSKDKVVATFNQVQQSITATPPIEAPNTTKTAARTEVNKEAQAAANTSASTTATTQTTS